MIDLLSAHSNETLVAATLLVALLLLLLRMLWSRRRIALRIRYDMLSVLPAVERCLEGSHDDLARWLRRVARRYPDETRSLVLVGDLLRREGGPLKASFLHRTLLYRKRLSEADRASILLALGRDHRALGDDEKALAALKQSLAAEKRLTTLRELVDLEREKGLFDDALFHQREANGLSGADRDEGLLGIMLAAAERAFTEGRLDEARRWGEMAARREGDAPFGRLLAVFNALCAGDAARAAELAAACLDRSPEEEVTLLYLLWHLPGGAATIRSLKGGAWLAPFGALLGDRKGLSPQELAMVDKHTVLYYHLWAQGAPAGEARDLAAAIGRRERLFACGACGRPLAGPVLSCAGCGLPLTVKWGTI